MIGRVVDPQLPRRRHRRITGPAGLLLFACMFVPAVRGCHEPIYPIETPMFLPPYLYGLAFACGALALTRRGLRAAILAVRAITVLTILGSIVLSALAPAIGLVELLAAAVVVLAIWGDVTERRAATAMALIGAICTVWFAAWTSTPEALIGVELSLVASLGLLFGGLWWLGEAVGKPPIDVPRAVARRRD
jgi:hypothetical protein